MSTHYVRIGERTAKVVLGPGGSASVDGVSLTAELRELAPGTLSLLLTEPDGRVRSFDCIADTRADGDGLLVDGRRIAYELADPRSLRTGNAAAGDSGPRPLKAPMPGRIVRVLVAEGDVVEAGQGCVVIEAMKMQNELKSPRAGKVSKLAAEVGETVAANAVLLVVD